MPLQFYLKAASISALFFTFIYYLIPNAYETRSENFYKVAVCIRGQLNQLQPNFLYKHLIQSNPSVDFYLFYNLQTSSSDNKKAAVINSYSIFTESNANNMRYRLQKLILRSSSNGFIVSLELVASKSEEYWLNYIRRKYPWVERLDRFLLYDHSTPTSSLHRKVFTGNEVSILNLYYSQAMCTDQIVAFEKQNSFKFDAVISTRADAFLFHPVNYTDLKTAYLSQQQCKLVSKNCTSWGGLNMQFQLFDRDLAMTLLGSRLNNYVKLYAEDVRLFDPEVFEKYQLDTLGVSYCQVPVEQLPVAAVRPKHDGKFCFEKREVMFSCFPASAQSLVEQSLCYKSPVLLPTPLTITGPARLSRLFERLTGLTFLSTVQPVKSTDAIFGMSGVMRPRMTSILGTAVDCPLRRNTSVLMVDLMLLTQLVKLLEGSVAVIGLTKPMELDFLRKYKYCQKVKRNIVEHQHSPDLWAPFHLLSHPATSKLRYNLQGGASNDTGSLFYLQVSYPCIAAVCTPYIGDHPLNENWASQDAHWRQLIKDTLPDPRWKLNNGLDFIITASHPMAPVPALNKNMNKTSFGHATFLTTDFDGTGDSARDIAVPYFTDIHGRLPAEHVTNKRAMFVFMAGTSFDYVRTTLMDALSGTSPDVAIFLDGELSSREYIALMQRSVFCLVIRGDTKSSRRLFSAISAGCIPVIISDLISLPFSNIIDYSSFALILPEGPVLASPLLMISRLRSIGPDEVRERQRAMCQVRQLLTYDSKHALNPVSLAIVEKFLHVKRFCESTSPLLTGGQYICDKIRRRVDSSSGELRQALISLY